MKARTHIFVAVGTISLLLLSVFGAMAQARSTQNSEPPPQSKMRNMQGAAVQRQMAEMMREPHHLLAMAYRQNIKTFAQTLREQVGRSSAVNVEFARAAVSEIRRSFDEMERHHQEHMRTMSEEMRVRMSAMMRQMEASHTQLRDLVSALERDVQADSPDARQIAAHASGIVTQLKNMSRMMRNR